MALGGQPLLPEGYTGCHAGPTQCDPCASTQPRSPCHRVPHHAVAALTGRGRLCPWRERARPSQVLAGLGLRWGLPGPLRPAAGPARCAHPRRGSVPGGGLNDSPQAHGSQLVTDTGQVGPQAGQTFSSKPSPTWEMSPRRDASERNGFSGDQRRWFVHGWHVRGSCGLCPESTV